MVVMTAGLGGIMRSSSCHLIQVGTKERLTCFRVGGWMEKEEEKGEVINFMDAAAWCVNLSV